MPPPPKRSRLDPTSTAPSLKWTKRVPKFEKLPVDTSAVAYKKLHSKIGEFSPAELWKCFVDDEVLKLITDHANQYAHERNAVNFIVTAEEMQTFIGILYITGYNRLPNMNAYWATRKSVGNMCIKDAMSRTRFKLVKSFIHVCDNINLDKAD
ncbi:PREDICTED: piggyBac transposable element-derived protein 1-like, partial [Rhagoletis zephyria]|uniref:piggyBac transposable element-derived protein 1-like n=1 Tax=Rhagoletis zephyria TaxID=28612 RepID=UPI0008119AEF